MGDSAATAVSQREEARIGREMMRDLRQSGRVLEDLEIQRYVEQLGYRLLSATGLLAKEYHFFVVKDPSINAFAMPGGYIGVHSGLILASRSEDELAAVIAHETAHVSQRHIARSFEKANNMNLPMTAAVLAAIILGSQNSQMGQAALAASIAGQTQMQLDYTRAHEREADRVGITMLAGAGYDPEGMAAFFERLQEQSRYSNGLPEYLSTHPVNAARIADARNRAGALPHTPTPEGSGAYPMIKAKLEALSEPEPQALLKRARLALESGRHQDPAAARYLHALALLANERAREGRDALRTLLDEHPQRITLRLALARAERATESPAQAEAVLREGLEHYPGNLLLTLALSELLLDNEQPAEARALLRSQTGGRPAHPQVHTLLARAERDLGRMGAYHLALARYHEARGEFRTAINQLNLAREQSDLDFYQEAQVVAKLEQLTRAAGGGKQPKRGRKRE